MEDQCLSRVDFDAELQEVEGGRKVRVKFLSRLTQHKAVSVVYIERVRRSERRCLSVRASHQHQRGKKWPTLTFREWRFLPLSSWISFIIMTMTVMWSPFNGTKTV